MSDNHDAIIIGGGIIGTATALHLARRGLKRVVLLEKSFLGAGSTGKSGAILRQHYSHVTTIKMARHSLKFFRDFHAATGRDLGFRQPGMVFLTHRRGEAHLKRNVALQQEHGVDTRTVDAAGLRELEPGGVFSDDVLGAFEADAAFVNPLLSVRAFAAEASSLGVRIEEGVGVTGILRHGDRITGVRLDDGRELSAGVVINTAGPWAGRLAAELGLETELSAIRPQQAYFDDSADRGRWNTIYGDLENDLYWKPEPAGWTRVGKMSYDGDDTVDPDRYDEGVSPEFIAETRERISRRLPRFSRSSSWGGCGALYTVTPDAHPVIGPFDGIEGFLIASGFSGHGFKMAPAVGEGLAALALGEDPAWFDRGFFAPDRFRRQEPITSAYSYGILG